MMLVTGLGLAHYFHVQVVVVTNVDRHRPKVNGVKRKKRKKRKIMNTVCGREKLRFS